MMAENLKRTIKILKRIKFNSRKYHIKEEWQFYFDYAIVLLEGLLEKDIKEIKEKKKIFSRDDCPERDL